MTKRKAERIIGAEITVELSPLECPDLLTVSAETDMGRLSIEGFPLSDLYAGLVDLHYKFVCAQVVRDQGAKCINCGLVKPLQGHHKELRSHGRDDRISNIEGRCARCHELAHGRRG